MMRAEQARFSHSPRGVLYFLCSYKVCKELRKWGHSEINQGESSPIHCKVALICFLIKQDQTCFYEWTKKMEKR